MKDYYQILQVPRIADANTIKKAYRKHALLWHPDVNPSAQASNRFKELNEAYYVLSDPQRRMNYDQRGSLSKFPHHFTAGDGKKYGTNYKYPEKAKRRKRKNKEPAGDFTVLENWMFYSLLFIGFIAILFSLRDLAKQEEKGLDSINGILFGLLFTFLLIYSWTQIYRKKKK